MPKKQAKNAYFYFMLEYKKKQERRGNKIDIKKVSELCSEPWKNLTASQRSKYETIAKNGKSEPGELYTAQGVSFSMIDKAKKEEDKAQGQLQSKLLNAVQSGVVKNCKYFYFYKFLV